ncbi:carboxylesterase/lipase family protein [Hydrogenophaga palleronii]|uniref:carboxylesterase/lipase family protein n=1 Tax=Hydrogenophaga palleronii TaxID=65655 RepID=UPI0008250ABA|nr:carboxylesterase family protein [Hydrogenophaga palleronii]
MKIKTSVYTALCAGALGMLLAACGGGGDKTPEVPAPEVRQTSLGTVTGRNDAASNGTYAWKGIPYAQPPVAALRWKAPQAPASWTGSRDATRFGNACLQNGRLYGPGSNNRYDTTIGTTLGTPVGHEDCLTLNVWRPANDTTGLPVIVFVHGGSNITGYTADPLYDGAALARSANAVVVTMNYRLGVLGFLNLPPLKTGLDALEDSGNFALLDIVQALKFVQQNMGSFGGNKDNVTLMGHSAGATNIWALMASPSAAGLFHKIVPLSGGISLASNLPANTIPSLTPATTAQGNGLLAGLVIAAGLATDDAGVQAWLATQSTAQVAAFLRAQSGNEVLRTVLARTLGGSGPIPDGTVLPLDPIAAFSAGHYNKVPVLAGTTLEEGKLFPGFLPLLGAAFPPGFTVNDAQLFTLLHDFNPDAPTTLTEGDILNPAYVPSTTPGTGWTALTGVLTNASFTVGRDNVLNALRTQQSDIWYYRFDWAQNPAPWNTVYGAAHGFDLPFVFGNFGPSLLANAIGSGANRPGREALAGHMMASLASFARTGNPNHTALGTTWPAWPGQLHFNGSLTQAQISTAP